MLSQAGAETGPSGVRQHSVGEWLCGTGEQQVEWCGQLVGFGHRICRSCHGYRVLSLVGMVISRLRSFPVGPLGRASTSQTRRGYLYAATRALTYSRSSSAVAAAPFLRETAAPTSSPSESCG